MKTLKGLIINLLAYAVITAVVIAGLNIYVAFVERSEDETLWNAYNTEFNNYFEAKYGSLNPVLKYFKRGSAEKEFNRIFVEQHGKLPSKTQPAKTARARQKHYLSMYFYLITPLWILATIAVYIIKRRYFIVRVIIFAVATAWILVTIYLPAMSGKQLHLVNTLVLIAVPAGIAWALMYLIEKKEN